MAAELEIFTIFKLSGQERYYLLKTERPSYSNASQSQQEQAEDVEEAQRRAMLEKIALEFAHPARFERIGELQNVPLGEAFYHAKRADELEVYYMETKFGHPWIVLGTAASEAEFLAELRDDEDLMALDPIGDPKKITALYFTEADFQ